MKLLAQDYLIARESCVLVFNRESYCAALVSTIKEELLPPPRDLLHHHCSNVFYRLALKETRQKVVL